MSALRATFNHARPVAVNRYATTTLRPSRPWQGQLPVAQGQRANYAIPPHDKKNDDLGGPYGQEPPNPEHRKKQNRYVDDLQTPPQIPIGTFPHRLAKKKRKRFLTACHPGALRSRLLLSLGWALAWLSLPAPFSLLAKSPITRSKKTLLSADRSRTLEAPWRR